MKKLINIVLIVTFMLVITGCDANYEVTLKGDKLSEKLTLKEPNISIYDKVNSNGWTVRELFDDLFLEKKYAEFEYDTKKLDENILSAEIKSNKMTLSTSTIINTCYPNSSVYSNGKNITFDSGKTFECYDIYDNLETVSIKFKTDHKIVSTNADKKVGNEYIWNLTKDSDKEILVIYSEKSKSDLMPIILLITGIAIIIALVFTIIIVKKNKANKI